MSWLEILLIVAVAALIYQEISWRDRARRLQDDYEKRLSAEVALAYEASLAGGERVRGLTFRAEKREPHGLFHEVTSRLFIALAMAGDSVIYAAGDLNEMDRFAIPPEIRRALHEFMSPVEGVAAGAGMAGRG